LLVDDDFIERLRQNVCQRYVSVINMTDTSIE